MTLVAAHAKLTLSLRVTGVRADGYHLIDAEMVTLDLYDTLEVVDGDGLEVIGNDHIEADDNNLVRKAHKAVGRSAHVTLTKRIPSGGGLGGGSADAAAVLRWAGCTDTHVAVGLGADVPFCLAQGRARVTGIGEIIEPLPHVARTFTLITPPLHVSTPGVYRMWDAMGGPRNDAGLNDLEPAALAFEPALVAWREMILDVTNQTPTLAGSGATWFVDGDHSSLANSLTGATMTVAHTTGATMTVADTI